MTPEELREGRRLLADATERPWRWIGKVGHGRGYSAAFIRGAALDVAVAREFADLDAALIVYAVNHLPALLDAADENQRLRDALRDDPAKWSFWTLVTIARLILASDYPPDVFTGTSGDPGPAFVARLRDALMHLDEALADAGGRDTACPRCHGDGVVTVGGLSVNPFSGCLGPDPQAAHDETCPDCHGTGKAE